MPNRSISRLPAYFVPAPLNRLNSPSKKPFALEIFDITYLHFHASLELGLCVSGKGCCIAEGKEFPFSAGDVQIIFPFQNHLSRSEGETYSRWYWVNIDPLELLGAWGAPGLPRLEGLLEKGMGLWGILDRERYPLAASLIARIAQPGEENLRLSCLCALIEELAAQSQTLPHLHLRPSRGFTRLSPALDAVRHGVDAGQPPAVAQLASGCGLSLAPFRRAFHQAMGQSPQQYIQGYQMRKAQQLLLFTDQPITQIALSVGYQDVSGFNRKFSQVFQMTPRDYRKQGKV